MTSPRHPNKHSVRWIYCKQSPQEDGYDAAEFGFSVLTSDLRIHGVQQVHVTVAYAFFIRWVPVWTGGLGGVRSAERCFIKPD